MSQLHNHSYSIYLSIPTMLPPDCIICMHTICIYIFWFLIFHYTHKLRLLIFILRPVLWFSDKDNYFLFIQDINLDLLDGKQTCYPRPGPTWWPCRSLRIWKATPIWASRSASSQRDRIQSSLYPAPQTLWCSPSWTHGSWSPSES